MIEYNKKHQKNQIIALIVAAGSGTRVGGDVPKQYLEIGGKSILARTIDIFLAHPRINGVKVVIARKHHLIYKKTISGRILCPPVIGGKTRQESVRRGLMALRHVEPSKILVHDAARPLLSLSLIDEMLDALEEHEAVIPALKIVDTLRHISNDQTHIIDRSDIYSIQTPQGFHYAPLLAAHEELAGMEFPDDAALFEKLGKKIAFVRGEENNFKITTASDIKRLMNILASQDETNPAEIKSEIKMATGFDVHALYPHSPDTPLDKQVIKICGVNIPHSHYLKGHSDADVGIHALVDALLGTICAGDIGVHFPPDDPKWKNADSDRFLLHAFEILTKKGGEIVHLDLTIICESPKITPYRQTMREHIAQLLKLDINRISIKATTTEKLGFTGRKEGIAAQAAATCKFN